jgi:hypothetical protein
MATYRVLNPRGEVVATKDIKAPTMPMHGS